MEAKKIDLETVREWLNEYLETEKEIDSNIERLEHLVAKMTGTSAQVLTGMPRASSSSTDRMAEMVANKTELEEEIRAAVSLQSIKRQKIEGILRKLSKVEERSVIRMRYFDRAEWKEVQEMLFGSKPDFEDRYDTYERRMHKYHRSALENIAKWINEHGSPNMAISTD